MTATVTAQITAPGVYDLPAEVYHADPVPAGSLSSTGARKLLPPSCPALFRHWRDAEERETKTAWDLGHAAHKLVLGAGPDLVSVEDIWGKDPNEWRTNNVKEQVRDIRAAGGVPLKKADYERVHAMADALRAHPWANALFAEGAGAAEQAVVWQDTQTGAWCRALIDLLPHPAPGRRFIFREYKTAALTAIQKPDRTIDDLGYYVQVQFHLAGIRALGLADDDAQALIAMQCKEPPYLVRVVQLDPNAMRIGALRVREAIDTYAACRAAEERGDPKAWPSWSDEPEWVSLMPWTERQYEEMQ